MSTPLDSLKDTFWRVRGYVDYATDHLAGNNILEDGHHVYDILDSAVKAATDALAEHVPGVWWDLCPRFSDQGWEAARTYDDGTPAIVTVKLDSGSSADYRPRHDGDLETFKAQFAPHLHAVEAVTA